MSRKTAEDRSPDSGRRDTILKAAQTIWMHYGFRRTSVEAIAHEAGISRTGLYHHFRSKEEIFRALASSLQERALQASERFAKGDELALEARLTGMLEAKLGRFYALFHDTRHGQELIDESNRLCGEEIAAAHHRYEKLIASVLADADRAGHIELAPHGLDARAAAAFLVDCAEGLKGRGAPPLLPEAYAEQLRRLVAMALRTWRTPHEGRR